ncbi:hypothetical protein DFH11DRAFT_1613336 [Phellopilus nigrolimitatus]|nr:hypothetical protein DFH11DRAFT_1613336 [Phellopilus nigrolimitatus]
MLSDSSKISDEPEKSADILEKQVKRPHSAGDVITPESFGSENERPGTKRMRTLSNERSEITSQGHASSAETIFVLESGLDDVETDSEDEDEDNDWDWEADLPLELEYEGEELKGSFDLYSMMLPSLANTYLPKGTETIQPEALYNKLLAFQSEDECTAHVFLPNITIFDGRTGIFTADSISDPFIGGVFEITVEDIEHTETLTFSKKESKNFVKPVADGPGLSARLFYQGEGCAFSEGEGTLKLKQIPVWAVKDRNGGKKLELFEGHFSFDVSYSEMYREMGHGEGANYDTPVWAIIKEGKM